MTTDRQWIYPMDSKADVVMPDGVHVYWSTHCRHGNHADCKGSCKICGSPCICPGCTHLMTPLLRGSTPIASPAPDQACCGDAEQGPDAHGTLLHTLGCRNRCGVDTTWYPPTSPLQGSAYPCGTTVGHEGDHWAPPGLRTPPVADEPAPVPPPVDALLKFIGEYAEWRYMQGSCDGELKTVAADKMLAAANTTLKLVTLAVTRLWAAGVAEGRRQAADDITEWLRQVEPSAVKYAPESPICTRQANAAVLGGYERAAVIARDGLRRNTHCSNCGDSRGGPFGHETSECTWNQYRLPDALGVPRESEHG